MIYCGTKNVFINKIKIEQKLKEFKKYKKILKYEGEFFNGLKNGKGKEYDINGKLIFEGNYLKIKIIFYVAMPPTLILFIILKIFFYMIKIYRLIN